MADTPRGDVGPKPRKSPAKKAAAKKAAAKKTPAKRAPAKKAPAKKAAARKSPAKKAAPVAPVLSLIKSPSTTETPPDATAVDETQQELIEDPPLAAFEMRRDGVPWPIVARRTGYASPRAAMMAVTALLQRAAMERSVTQRQVALQTQLSRYERLLETWMPLANRAEDKDAGKGPDANAAAIVLRTLSQIDRLEGFGTEADAGVVTRQIVIAADPDAYERQLQMVIDGRAEEIIDGTGEGTK